MLYNLIAILISLLIPSFLLYKTDRFKIIMYVIMVFGCMIRLIGIENVPNELYVDEASAGYDSFSLVTSIIYIMYFLLLYILM